MNVDEGQVADTGEEAEITGSEEETVTTGGVDKVALLEQQVQELKAALGSQNQGEAEEVFEPKPFFTDEEFGQIDDEQKALYRAFNESHMANQELRHRIEQLEAGSEVVGQERSIENYISSTPKLSDDPKLAKTFRETVNTVMKGDGADLLEAVTLLAISRSKGKPNTKGSTSKPASVAGAVRRDVKLGKPASVEQGVRTAKDRILEKISKAKL